MVKLWNQNRELRKKWINLIATKISLQQQAIECACSLHFTEERKTKTNQLRHI